MLQRIRLTNTQLYILKRIQKNKGAVIYKFELINIGGLNLIIMDKLGYVGKK